MAGRHLGCSVGRHRWLLKDQQHLACLHCGKTRKRRKRPLCYLGLHNWITMQKADARYLACRNCGKYGGDPGRWFPVGYGDVDRH